MKWLLAQKKEMTQRFDSKGNVRTVTVVHASLNTIVGVKTIQKDGYASVQLGFCEKKRAKKPQRVSFGVPTTSKGNKGFRYVKEGRLDSIEGITKGDSVACDLFSVGDRVDVTGWSKGHGFTGVVKRHGFHGHPATHGHKDQLRMPGSIGSGGVQHVFKGLRMAGRMGNERVTVKDLEILEIDTEKSEIAIAGSLPGARNGLLILRAKGDFTVTKKEKELPIEDQKHEALEDQKEIEKQVEDVQVKNDETKKDEPHE